MASYRGSFHKIKMALFLLFHGHAPTLFGELKKELGSEEICYGFRRDLAMPVKPPEAAMPVTLRSFEKNDVRRRFHP